MSTVPEKSPAERLATPVQFLRGVGPRRGELFERLGLRTVRDLLFYFPRGYQDLTDVRTVAGLEEGVLVSVLGVVEDVELRETRPGRNMLGVLVRAEGGTLRGTWFNQPVQREWFRVGQQVLMSGKPNRKRGYWQMNHPRVETVDDEQSAQGRLLPVYGLTDGLAQRHLRGAVTAALEVGLDALEETFTDEFLERHNLWPIRRALPEAHFPTNRESCAAARRRFIYQEFLTLQLALAIKRQQQRDLLRSPVLESTAKIHARIERLFPYELTTDQRRAIEEVAADLGRAWPMNRLLQGDVGSGKTVVAVYAMLLAVAHGYQAVLMAPTEVLARQHARTLDRMLAASQVRRGLLTGTLTAATRRDVLAKIAAGEIDVVVGTQALVQPDVAFRKLGLVVIDEQHKFGVRQRAMLKQAGTDPHYLVMTATPIPRTLLMSSFGDLDVSTLREAPPGRQTVHTYLAQSEQRAKWWEFFRKKLREGRQGYVIAPLVEDSEAVAVASLQEAYESLANGELEEFRLGLIHGRLTTGEKEAAMEAFRRGETQVLVSTTVVEVGIDVPNATLMTIEGGAWFGLSQLHQLRGRVSRGSFPGYCCVFADGMGEEALRRLEAFVSTTDGFKLAELDFEQRGPGDWLGTRQHGLPPFLIADLQRDAAVLQEARKDAADLVSQDPGLAKREHARLRKTMLLRYGKELDLGDVG